MVGGLLWSLYDTALGAIYYDWFIFCFLVWAGFYAVGEYVRGVQSEAARLWSVLLGVVLLVVLLPGVGGPAGGVVLG